MFLNRNKMRTELSEGGSCSCQFIKQGKGDLMLPAYA